ncbi:MAG: peptidoglycan editing factor PgeF [Acidobacteria bacterium]|nr:peptidoglycan editing factor PgeF [Acidobacteriota bacterium]
MGWLVHGFSTRNGGHSKPYGGAQLNLGFTTRDSKAAVVRNRRTFLAALNQTTGAGPASPSALKSWPLLALRQIHSDIIHRITEMPGEPMAGDGLITSVPGILISVLTADCLPVILVDRKHRAVGVFHAGWRGTVKRIVEKGVGEMRRSFGTEPGDLVAALGPEIRRCCYEVGPEVREAFDSQFSYAAELFRETKEQDRIHEKYPLLFLTARAPGHSELPSKVFLDIAEANRRQLIAAGVPPKNISDLNVCTSCRNDLFFSHRREKAITGRMMAVVGIRE